MAAHQCLILERLWAELSFVCSSPLFTLLEVEFLGADELIDKLPGFVLTPVLGPQGFVCLIGKKTAAKLRLACDVPDVFPDCFELR